VLVFIAVDFRCEQLCLLLVLGSWSAIIVKGAGSFNHELIQANIGFTIHASKVRVYGVRSLVPLIRTGPGRIE
jgi:hypothetical protein